MNTNEGISETGIWSKEIADTSHDFSYRLARFMGDYLKRDVPLIDFGCGPAEYLRYFHNLGFQKLCGVEGTKIPFEFGDVVEPGDESVETKNGHTDIFGKIIISDLSKPFKIADDCKGNVMTLEVGEHIPIQYSEVFINSLVDALGKGCKLFMSWAIPGQDGIGHVACQHNIWVIREMEKRKLKFLADDSLKAREGLENRVSYFRNTIMIFQK